MTKQQIIQETKDFYAGDPVGRRALDVVFGCKYITEDGRMCAFGRVQINPTDRCCNVQLIVAQFIDPGKLKGLDINDSDVIPVGLLKQQYDGHEIKFWQDLQMFHDTHTYWDKEGLTKRGYDQFDHLMETYKS